MSKFCTKCGKEVGEGASFCASCGTSVSQVAVNDTNVSSQVNTNMNNNKKKMNPIVIVLLVLLFIGISGFIGLSLIASVFLSFFDSNVSKPKVNINQVALEYVSEKYDDKCTYAAPWGNSMSGTREFIASCNTLGNSILIQIEDFKTDNYIIRDNYLAVKYETETKNIIENAFKENLASVNVFYTASKYDVNDFDDDISFNEYIEKNKNTISPMVELKASEYSHEVVENIAVDLSNTFGSISFAIVVVKDDIFGTLDSDELNDLVALNQEVDSTYIEAQSGKLIEVDWKTLK